MRAFVAICAIAVGFALAACDQGSHQGADGPVQTSSDMVGASTGVSPSIPGKGASTSQDELASLVKNDFNDEIQVLSSGGRTEELDLSTYLAVLTVNLQTGALIGWPDWSSIKVSSSETGTVKLTADSPAEPAAILFVDVPVGSKIHKLAYAGIQNASGHVYRHFAIDADGDGPDLAEWRRNWMWRPK